MKKDSKGSIILVGILFIITLIIGIYGLIISVETKKSPKPSSSVTEPSSMVLEDSYSFNEKNLEEICDFTTTNICERSIGSFSKDSNNYNLNIKYEKLENNEFNLDITANGSEFITIEKMTGVINMFKVYKRTYLVIDVIDNNENVLKIYDNTGASIEPETIKTKGNIVYNEDNITFKSLNCESEFKDNVFNAVLTIEENNKANILYEKTEDLNTTGTKCS